MTTPRLLRRVLAKSGIVAPPVMPTAVQTVTAAPITAAGTGVSEDTYAAKVWETVFTFNAVAITITDADTNGAHGSLKFADFAAGLVRVLGGITDLSLTAAAGIGATGAIVCGVGTATVGTDNATLTGTEQNIIPSTSVTLAASAGSLKAETTATEGAVTLDGTDTAADLFLNMAVSASDASANSTVTVSGSIRITWVQLGDN
jgi:hypothetical protein